MKKIALLLAVFIMCAGLYACDENKQESKPTGSITVMVTDAVKEYAGTWVALGPEESTIVLNPNGTAVVDEKDYGGRAFWWGEHASIPERLCI